MKRTILAFAFPAEAGPHLPTTEGWKAEFASTPQQGVKSAEERCVRDIGSCLLCKPPRLNGASKRMQQSHSYYPECGSRASNP